MILVTHNPKLSIIVPAYEENSVLRQNIESIDRFASKIGYSYEIIIAEDGGSEETRNILSDISNHFSNVIHIHSDHRLGKGLAVMRALKKSNGEILLFMDADLSTSLIHMNDVIKLVKNGFDVVLGSRHIKGSYVKRPLSRVIASRAYNLVVKFLFWDDISDHQCGFKGFNRQALRVVINEVTECGFLFDTELILRMKQKGLKIIEIPVIWKEPEDRISKFNLLTDGLKMGLHLVKLRFNIGTRGKS